MDNLLTYFNISWDKYLHLFNEIDNVQIIFLIPKSEEKKCLYIGEINNLKIYEISGIKIKNIINIGPFITQKKFTIGFDGEDIESSIIKFYYKNRYLKWLAVVTDDIDLYENNFNKLLDFYKINYNLAYLIPHRNRSEQLEKTVEEINKYIKFKNLDADVWIIEQSDLGDWNKGCNLNIGFLIVNKFYKYFIFNDCDSYLELFTNYSFPAENEIVHLFGYQHCLGGIFSCDRKTFLKLNGFNNNFFNWGREDRDLEDRCKRKKIKINRNNLIKVNKKGVKQLEHTNLKNYWNYQDKDPNFYSSRESYYINQVKHYLKIDNGLINLKIGNTNKYRITMISINLVKWTNSSILIKDENFLLSLNIEPENDTGLMRINNLILPINPEEKYPKILIKISYNKINIKLNYFLEEEIKINLFPKNIKINYQNVELDYDSIYTIFDSELINYNYSNKTKKTYFLINSIF